MSHIDPDQREGRAAIRNEGQNAENLFMHLVMGARSSQSPKSGDAVVDVDGEAAHVEVKECHAPPYKNGTINQVRPIKYITCVVWAPERGCWHVIPPDHLVRIAASKSRGQHTEIPFECMNFTLNSLPADTKCDDHELSERVAAAIRQGRNQVEIRDLMRRLQVEIGDVRDRYCNAARDRRTTITKA